ncbi:MAG: tetratricopeptide repeat protein, partial [Microcoleaceae cyanobacterium]
GKVEEGLATGETALKIDGRYADVDFLKENLWGDRLIGDTARFLATPRMKETIAQLAETTPPTTPTP